MQDKHKELRGFYQARGMAGRVGFGERPAILVVDYSVGFTNPQEPLGGDFSAELLQTKRILDKGREIGLPIIFTTGGYHPQLLDAGRWYKKMPSAKTLLAGSKNVEIDATLGYRPETESLIVKKFASAFFGTDLITQLVSKNVDTVIVAGCTTSGCIRATVVDACQYGFHTIIALEAVGDRAQGPHEANLFDMDAKYGDVVPIDEILEYMAKPIPC